MKMCFGVKREDLKFFCKMRMKPACNLGDRWNKEINCDWGNKNSALDLALLRRLAVSIKHLYTHFSLNGQEQRLSTELNNCGVALCNFKFNLKHTCFCVKAFLSQWAWIINLNTKQMWVATQSKIVSIFFWSNVSHFCRIQEFGIREMLVIIQRWEIRNRSKRTTS